MTNVNNYLIVGAIDFGTTYSGYAFSTRHDYMLDPTNISTTNWVGATGGLLSHKTPTCILFDPEERFHSFGYEAEDMYTQLAEEGNHSEWMFFSRFKMCLYDKMIVDKDMTLQSESGKSMSTKKVVAESIRYLKDELIKRCVKEGECFKDSDIKWVLTVPAIWTDTAKDFMRNAAVEAGIKRNRLLICLEPEAAALYIKEVSSQRKAIKQIGYASRTFSAGSKYLVCDAGGGTVDMTVQEIQDDGRMKELQIASGGDFGGTKVDDGFMNLLISYFGHEAINKVTKEYKVDMLEILRSFEVKKRSVTQDMNFSIFIRIPQSLKDIYDNLKDGEEEGTTLDPAMGADLEEKHHSTSKDDISNISKDINKNMLMKRDKLEIKPRLAQGLFRDPVVNITDHIKKMLPNEDSSSDDINTILLVGGFSEAPMLQAGIEKEFPDKRVIILPEAGLAVLKGATIYGHDPKVFSERKSRYTYGLRVSEVFIEGHHDPAYRYVNGRDQVCCGNIFSPHIRKGDSVNIGKTHSSQDLGMSFSNVKQVVFIYCSTASDPKYTTGNDCTKLGQVVIDIPYTSLDVYKDKLTIDFSFKGTEFEVKVVFKKTGKVAKSVFKFES